LDEFVNVKAPAESTDGFGNDRNPVR
jgi:hypothetical protein